MVRSLIAAAAASCIASLIATAAVADDGRCTAPQGDWQPMDALRQQLAGEGLTVRELEVDDGCYKVHAVDAAGVRSERSYDPQTLALVAIDDDADGHDGDDD
jgi:hypothetical protein